MLRLIHLMLALILFISATGLVLNKHYCQDQLKSIALFVEAKPCHEQKTITKPCPIHGTMEVPVDEDDDNCCDNETEYVKVEQEQINQSFEIDGSLPLPFLAAFVDAFLMDHPITDKASIDFINYRPPILVYDQPVVLQTFLC